jgi:hypothetical protein
VPQNYCLRRLLEDTVSDVSKGPDWWQGTDGLWYPPVARKVENDTVAQDIAAEGAATKPRRKRKAFVVVALLAVAAGLGTFLFIKSRPQETRVSGTFALIDETRSLDENCNTSGGYSDINSSTQVVLRNKDGVELDRTDLGIFVIPLVEGGGRRRCTWSFFLDVKDGEPYYILSVGRRGEMSYTFEELKNGVSLSLGD